MFDYDWFHGSPLEQQKEEARIRCVRSHFQDVEPKKLGDDEEVQQFRSELELRCLIYLRDGFSYEVRELANVSSKAHLTFECEPVDDQYKVGSFVVSVPFDEIVRVELFAVHPAEKPEELPQITGFKASPDSQDGKRPAEKKKMHQVQAEADAQPATDSA